MSAGTVRLRTSRSGFYDSLSQLWRRPRVGPDRTAPHELLDQPPCSGRIEDLKWLPVVLLVDVGSRLDAERPPQIDELAVRGEPFV